METAMSAILAPARESRAGPAFPGLNDWSAGEPAIDLVHLARQTDNDSALEEELLALFDRQSASLLAQLSAEDAPPRRRADAAHLLRGSALAVGAGRIARAAQALEASLARADAEKQEIDRAVAALAAAVGEARAAIARLRG
jgi:HPt (histidine-containing phosphotransfer) domain-containing protein